VRRSRAARSSTSCHSSGGNTPSGSFFFNYANSFQGTNVSDALKALEEEPEGMAADERGNIFAGLTSGCDTSASGGCLQKWVKK
jgi:hypothetical protein